MTQIEDRVRSGLEAEAEAIAKATRTAPSTFERQGRPLSGAGVALGVAAVLLVVFGGVSLVTGGGGDVVNQPVATPTTSLSADTSLPSTNSEGEFEEPVLVDGTPIDDSTASNIGTMMGGEPLSDEELERITGSAGLAHSGYLIESTTTAGGGAYELGLIVYREEPLVPLEPPMLCFSTYAMTQGVNVAGGATCAYSQEQAVELAEFHLGSSGSCGPHPKEEPVVDGIWTTIAVWGIPETANTVTVGLGNGGTVDIEARNGVALHLWEESVDIISITFDSMTEAQRDLLASWLPARGIGSDCGRGDASGG